MQGRNDRTLIKITMGVVVVVILSMVGCVALLSHKSSITEDAARGKAESACRSQVKERLKSPSSARFVDGYTTVERETDGFFTIKVVGVVEAENSLGARKRLHYTCRSGVLKDGGDATAEVLSLDE